MKRIISVICIGTLALSATAWAKDRDRRSKVKGKARHSAVVQKAAPRSGQAVRRAVQFRSRSISNARFNRSRSQLTARTKANVAAHRNVQSARTSAFRKHNSQTATTQSSNRATIRRLQTFERNRSQNAGIARARNFNRNKSNASNGNRSFAFNRRSDVRVTNNWRGDRFRGEQYAAFRNYNRQWHNRDWWRHHHSRIVFYFGAPYYWSSGYWYPAWGYYPDYVYAYDGPIYGYNGLSPEQVAVNVQLQLQQEGYYAGPIDGIIGPMTRQALAAYQADHGLAITSAVDEPTLETLGLS